MKIFGSIEHFALQAEDLEPADKFIFGRLCLWAGGMQIGDNRQTVLLAPIADFLRGTLRLQNRNLPLDLGRTSAEEILTALQAAHRELLICPNGCEAFDGELAALVQAESGHLFIWRQFSDKRIHQLPLAPLDYVTVVQGFLAWLDPLTGFNPESERFAGKTFVVVGQFSRSHAELARLIRSLGGRLDFVVSQRTSYLLAGQLGSAVSPSINQASSLGVAILSEADFDSLLLQGKT